MKKYILPVLWMVVIFILSSIPGSVFPKIPFPGFDKLVHLMEYGILGFLWAKAFNSKITLTILIGIIFGIFDEIHQIFIPFREFSILDLLFDGIGVIFGSLCPSLLKR